METDETENGKLKRKAETEKLKFGNGRHKLLRQDLPFAHAQSSRLNSFD